MNDKPKIFIVEDEKHIARFLQLALEKEGFRTATESNGKRAYEKIVQDHYDIVLLDVMLPEMDGMEVCRKVREISDVPIIMLTARDEVKDQVSGLNLGANDYMTKPFASEVLIAKIRGILSRRESLPRPGKMLLVDTVKGELIELTHREYELLQYLVENKTRVLNRDQILQKVWGYDYAGDTNVVDVYISYLRTKIDYRFNERHIHTIRGVGYVLKD